GRELATRVDLRALEHMLLAVRDGQFSRLVLHARERNQGRALLEHADLGVHGQPLGLLALTRYIQGLDLANSLTVLVHDLLARQAARVFHRCRHVRSFPRVALGLPRRRGPKAPAVAACADQGRTTSPGEAGPISAGSRPRRAW